MNEQAAKVYDFFLQQGFLPADKESYPVFKKYDQYSMLQEMGAAIITTWHFTLKGLYKIIHGYLCSVYFYIDEPIQFAIHRLPPEKQEYLLGHIIDILYGMVRKAGLPALRVKFIEARFLKEYQAIAGYDILTEESGEDHVEYAYRTKDLLELSGVTNYYKRKRLKRFLNDTNISLHPMTRENVHLCFQVEKEWCQKQDCAYCASFSECEKNAMEIMADIFDERIHTGILAYYKDMLAGYVICEKISKKLAFLYFGKANIDGFFMYLIYMMFKEYLSDVEYMNINEDMGKQGLRIFKRHLSAYETWQRYSCIFTKTGKHEE